MFDRLKRIIWPTGLQTFASALLATAVVIGVYQSVLVPRLYGTALVSQAEIDQGRQTDLIKLNSFSPVRTGVQVGFWALVGIACYLVYLAITNAIIETRNEMTIDTQYANRGRFSRHMRQYGYQLLAAIGLIAFLALTASLLLPFWQRLIDALVFDGPTVAHAASAVVGWLGLAATIYVGWMLVELTFAADSF